MKKLIITVFLSLILISSAFASSGQMIIQTNGFRFYDNGLGTYNLEEDILYYNYNSIPARVNFLPVPTGTKYTIYWKDDPIGLSWSFKIGELSAEEMQTYTITYSDNIPAEKRQNLSTLDYNAGQTYWVTIENDVDLSDGGNYPGVAFYPYIELNQGNLSHSVGIDYSKLNIVSGGSENISSLSILQQPVNQDIYVFNTYSFTCIGVNGANELTYQWQYRTDPTRTWSNATVIGNTTDTITVPAILTPTNRNGYQYRCRVRSGGLTVYSNIVDFTYKNIPAYSVNIPAGYAFEAYLSAETTFHAESDSLANNSYLPRTSGQFYKMTTSEDFEIDISTGTALMWNIPSNYAASFSNPTRAGTFQLTSPFDANTYLWISNPLNYQTGTSDFSSNGSISIEFSEPIWFGRLIPLRDAAFNQNLNVLGGSYHLGPYGYVPGDYNTYYSGSEQYTTPLMTANTSINQKINDVNSDISSAENGLQGLLIRARNIGNIFSSLFDWLPPDIRTIVIGSISAIILTAFILVIFK